MKVDLGSLNYVWFVIASGAEVTDRRGRASRRDGISLGKGISPCIGCVTSTVLSTQEGRFYVVGRL